MFITPVSGIFLSKVRMHEPVVSNKQLLQFHYLRSHFRSFKIDLGGKNAWHLFSKHVQTKIPIATLRSRCTILIYTSKFFKIHTQSIFAEKDIHEG